MAWSGDGSSHWAGTSEAPPSASRSPHRSVARSTAVTNSPRSHERSRPRPLSFDTCPRIGRFLGAITREQTDHFRPGRDSFAPIPGAHGMLIASRKRTLDRTRVRPACAMTCRWLRDAIAAAPTIVWWPTLDVRAMARIATPSTTSSGQPRAYANGTKSINSS
jgi:hypothetical protein